jgi:protein-L-isoaspartate(D-aspartate) O-methyltransferase
MTADAYEAPRLAMVRDQLAARDIRDPRVLEAFRKVPRHLFVHPSLRAAAYEDHPVAIGAGQTISQPYMAATMTEALRLGGGERVLEIGTGSGYQAAVLRELGADVWTIERLPELAASAAAAWEKAGVAGIHARVGDGSLGWPEEAPFDRIVVTAGAPAVPAGLPRQLREGGWMLVPVGGAEEQELLRVERDGSTKRICACVFVKLVGREGW